MTLLLVAASAACSGDGPNSPSAGRLASVAVSPEVLNLAVGATGRFGAILTDSSGNVLRGRSVFWSSADTTIATVDQDGLVTARRSGSVQIAANSEGLSGVGSVVVRPPGPATITVNPPSATVLVGQSTPFMATVRDAFGNVVTGATPAWSSGNSSVATVTQQGVVSGVSPGTATITASLQGVSGTATVTVQRVPVARVVVSPSTATRREGQTLQLTAKTYDAQGNELTGRSITWSTSSGQIATVTSSGLVSAKKEGSATITATSEGQSGTMLLTVTK